MEAAQIKLVQDSLKALMPVADEAAAMFYRRLFELDPRLRRIFQADPGRQGRQLMGMLESAVTHLRDLQTLRSALEALGRRHVAYGVDLAHYETGRVALIWTLRKVLGDAFTKEMEFAWDETYESIAGIMKNAPSLRR